MVVDFQYPQPRVYAMKLWTTIRFMDAIALSVPSTSGLRDETHRIWQQERPRSQLSVPSTSGLRDETGHNASLTLLVLAFQYPQPRVYAMKHKTTRSVVEKGEPFSTLNLGSTR